MYKKIVGILVCTLFIASMAIPISALNKDYERPVKPTGNSADVPIWEVGDTWTYKASYYESDINETLVFTLEGEVTYEVIDDTGDFYILVGSGRPLGIIQYGNIGLRTSRFSSASFELKIRKSDLSLVYNHQLLKGICWLTLGGIPLPIPIQIKGSKNSNFSPDWELIPFPLFDGKTGTIGSIELTEESSTTLFWGLVVLSEGNGSWNTGNLDYTVTEEQITVPAGTYDVYFVEVIYPPPNIDDYYNGYYCEEFGNSIKQSIKIVFGQDPEKTYLTYDLELISTTYSP